MKITRIFVSLFFLYLFLFINTASAQTTQVRKSGLGCAQLAVAFYPPPDFSSETICKLQNKKVIAGKIIKGSVPDTLSNEKYGHFIIEELTGYKGIDIRLEYLCKITGGKSITVRLKSKQNPCVFKAGHITAESNHGLFYSEKWRGGYPDKPGILRWCVKR